ncbi:unnamed protein product [Colias eurytheme]|nr:unnamed protein product [Colias eurytheme]
MREYRARKKKDTLTVNHQKQKKSAAERTREYRIRKKAKIRSGDLSMNVSVDEARWQASIAASRRLHVQLSEEKRRWKDILVLFSTVERLQGVRNKFWHKGLCV